jgi:hypothetical protein
VPVSSNYLIRGILRATPRGSTPERRWRLLLALVTITPDAEGWRDASMKLLGEYAQLSQPHLREARDELVSAGLLEFQHEGKGHGARHYQWRILAQELNPSGSSEEQLNHWGSTAPQGVEPKSETVEPPKSLTSDDSAPCSFVLSDDDDARKEAGIDAAAAAVAARYGWSLDHSRLVADGFLRRAKGPVSDAVKYVLAATERSSKGRSGPTAPRTSRSKPTPGPRCSNSRPIVIDADGTRTCCPDHDSA